MCFLIVFFFFQAEDGIRDGTVTGVQTCALPISDFLASGVHSPIGVLIAGVVPSNAGFRSQNRIGWWASEVMIVSAYRPSRSEERRVGKECRYRRSPDH